MSSTNRRDGATLSLADLEKIEAAQAPFEMAWQGGAPRRIEDALAQAALPAGPAFERLLGNLIAIELEGRVKEGQRPRAEEYHARFPDHSVAIEAAFGELPGLIANQKCPEPGNRVTASNLLFGLLAIQNGFIGRKELVGAFGLWLADRSRPLAALLLERGGLSLEQHDLLEALVGQHLKKHGDAEASLESFSSVDSVRSELEGLGDLELDHSLSHVGERHRGKRDESEATADQAVDEGERIGRFRVLRLHKRGGLGEVYVARDEEVRRTVAFKRIQGRCAADGESRARFELEAEITGRLEHPGIVPVYGLGHYGDGRPFYAMRFIEGENSLKDAIARFHGKEAQADPGVRHQELLRLLRRFLDACNAMAYAHSKGVLHRDLKPGNILLGPFGETLVVDWGLAKATGQRDPGSSIEASMLQPESGSELHSTQLGRVIGTPAYMPPEQARGELEALGPRSDVYSLGATLYAILTGRAPFAESDHAATIEKVVRGEFPRPRAVCGWVDLALEAVCLKAMRVEAEDRHASPRELARDLELWLADEPVSCWKEPAGRRARRWMRKHRTLVTTAAAVLLLGTGAATVVAIQQVRHARVLAVQRTRAEEREQQAIDAVKRFGDVVREEPLLKDSPELEALRKRLLQEPLAFFKSLREQLQSDHDTRPEALARLGSAAWDLGNLTREIGDEQDALRLYEESLAIFAPLTATHSATPQFQRALASSHYNVGLVRSATGHPEEALAWYTRALEIEERLAREHPTVTRFQSDLAHSHYNIGVLQSEMGRSALALTSYTRAREIQERLAREHPAVAQFQSDLARTHNTIGLLQSAKGQSEEALAWYTKSREIRERLVQEYPAVTEFQGDLAISHNNIGNLQSATGRREEALASYARAREIQEHLAEKHPVVTGFQRELAISHNNIGVLHRAAGHPKEALASYTRAREIRERLAREHPTVTGFQSDLGTSHDNIGNVQRATGHQQEALASCTRAREIRERLAREHPAVTDFQRALAISHINIGNLQSDTGHPAEALESFKRAREIDERLSREHPTLTQVQGDLVTCHDNIGILQRAMGHPEEALASFNRAREIGERLAREHPTVTQFHRELAFNHFNIGVLQAETGHPEVALASYRRAREIQERLAREHPRVIQFQSDLGRSHNSIGLLQSAAGHLEQALASYSQAREIRDRLVREHPESPDFAGDLGATLNNLAMVDLVARRWADARVKLVQAVSWQRKALSANPRNPTYRQFLANHYKNLIQAARGLNDLALADEAQRGLAELAASDPQAQALNARLAEVIRGSHAKDNAERLALAQQAYDTKRFAIAARLWGEALERDPKLVDDRKTGHRYNAACSAALAGSGQGTDQPPPTEAEKRKLRQRALDWLTAELEVWTKLLESATAEQRAVIVQTLHHWRATDTDLAGIRDEAELARLPDAERQAFRKLWADVDALLARARDTGAKDAAKTPGGTKRTSVGPAGVNDDALPANPFARAK
jgi:eukaryotic-like serine/threonine-protein kinase